MESEPIEIRSTDYWFKIIEMLQQNWALIDTAPGGTGCTVFFLGDTSGVFDQMCFASSAEAKAALHRNGFARFAEDKNVQKFIYRPQPPFHEASHPNGPIYSSGRYWLSTTNNKGPTVNKKTNTALAPLVQKRRNANRHNYTRRYKCIGDYHAGAYECDYVSPYTKCAANLNADIMVILQDWASDDYLAGPFDQNLNTFGRDPDIRTNINLDKLLCAHCKLAIGQIYATNLFPFVKFGEMTEKIPMGDLIKAAREFCVPQLRIVSPKIAVCLGLDCFNAMRAALTEDGKPTPPIKNINEAIKKPFTYEKTTVFCQAHTGQLGRNMRNRNDPLQVDKDWAKMCDQLKGNS